MKSIDYNTIQFQWAEEIMKQKEINILDVNWNKFKTKEEIEQFIEMLEKTTNQFIKENN